MSTRSSVEFVPEEALFNPETDVTVSGIDIDRESPLIIDRCLNDVRARILRSQEQKGSSVSSSSSHRQETMASHLDDVSACRDRVWQHIYHPKHKQNVPAIINIDLSSGSVIGVPETSSSPAFASVHDQNESSPPKSAYDALKKMEEAQKKALEAETKVRLDDVACRSSGTSTRGEGEGAGGDLISQVVDHQVVRMVTVDNKKKNDGGGENTNENNTKKNDTNPTNKAATNPLLNRKAALAARIKQSQKDTLLALYDAVRPDPLVGAAPLPIDHFWNHPYASKRSTNMLLLKYLGIMYPGGKNELRRELPFTINKKTREITSSTSRRTAGSSAPSSSTAPLSARGRLMQQDSDSLGKLVDKQLSEGRSLMLYEDRRRRAFLFAIATQLGGGIFSSATAADFITFLGRDGREGSKALLRIGAGTDLSASGSHNEGIHEQSRQRKIQTLQALYYLSGHNSASFKEAVIAATRPTRPLTAQMLEYALSCLKASPFSVSHYPVKLFGFVQPTSIGGHSNFPLTRFNVFELDHLPTPTDKLRANARRIKALRASERQKKEGEDQNSNSTTNHHNDNNSKGAAAAASAKSGNDTEQLLLKKWSVQGTVFPAVGSYHVKALWSANAKLSLPEACKALGIFGKQPANSTSSSSSSSAAQCDGVDQQQPEDTDERSEELGISSNEEEATAKAFRSRYRRKTAQRERGLVGLSFDSDRLRAISLVHSSPAPLGSADENGAMIARVDAAAIEGASPEEISRKDAAGLIAEAEKQQSAEEVPEETNAASPPATVAAAAASPHVRRRPKAPPEETVSRPLRAADREVVGSYQDSEATLTWRRLWNPRWSLEGCVRHVESIPSAQEQDRAVLAAMNLYDNDGLLIDFDTNSAAFSIPPPLVGPTATIFGIRLRYENSGRLFPRGVGSFFDGFFAPLFISGANVSVTEGEEGRGGSPPSGNGNSTRPSSKLSAPRGWVASTCAMSAFLDPIQRHVQLKGQIDLRKLTPLPWWRGGQRKAVVSETNKGEEEKVIYIIDDGSSVCADSASIQRQTSSSSPRYSSPSFSTSSSFLFVPRLYERARDLLSFDLRIRVAAESKFTGSEGGKMAFITEGDSRQYSPIVAAINDDNSSTSTTMPASVRNLRRYVRSVKLPNQSTVQTVRGVHGNFDHVGLSGGGGSVASSVTSASYPEAYSTERLAGNWFVTSTVEMSKPISFISFGGSKPPMNKDTPIPPPPPPLRFLVFWNGLWSENLANNKESVGYAVRREPHASRRELKGWYNEYLPSSLECSWSSVWSRSKQSFTNDPAPADLPAGSTFFKFMKCGAIWDL